MIEDRKLTENFSLYELTTTNFKSYQDDNRILSDPQIEKLTEVAKLLEQVRLFLGVPLKIHSGYRCLYLNRALHSKDSSQHLLCEAVDWTPIGLELGNCFRLIWKEVLDGRMKVGQLIYETDARSYGAQSWIHLSLGEPYRPAERCNQILRMEDGAYSFLRNPQS